VTSGIVARICYCEKVLGICRPNQKVFCTPNEPVSIKNGQCVGNAESIEFNCQSCGPVCVCAPSKYSADAEAGSDGQSQGGLQASNAAKGLGNAAGMQVAPPAACRARMVKGPALSLPPSVVVGDCGKTNNYVASVDACFNGEIGNCSVKSLTEDDYALIKPMIDSLPDCVTATQRDRIKLLLQQNIDLFARHEYDVGKTSLLQHRLELAGSTAPVRQSLRRHPIAYLELIDKEVAKLLDANLIAPCNSHWASNVVLVKKKSSLGSGEVKLRVTVDFREVNARLRRLQFPMPDMSSIIDSLQGFKFFTAIDLANAYLSVPLDPETNDITAFVTRRGMFKFLRLSAGIASGPRTHSPSY
jgi:hypothetical protein